MTAVKSLALTISAFLLAPVARPTLAQASGFDVISTAGLGDELTCFGMSHRDPNFVMVGTHHGKIHRSDDGGATWQEVLVTPFRFLFLGRERDGDPKHDYALGLPGKSPLLQRWLRQKGLHTSGINLQQLLVKRGDKMVAVNWIEVDWNDENRVYVGTTDGLYRSTDKGRTFVRIWQGYAGTAERIINTVATDPADPQTLMVGTTRGLFVSRNRGVTFRREMNFYIRDSYIRAFFFDRNFKGLVHMAMGGAAMASPDSGKNWITTYWDLWRPRSAVQWISLGPNNIRLIGTRDGLFASFQGGEMGTWKRRGVKFVGQHVSRVLATSQPNVWYASTDAAVWRSSDYGNNWRKIMQLGGKEFPVWLHAHQGSPKHMWLMTNKRLYRFGGLPNRQPVAAAGRSLDRRLLDIPEASEFRRYVLHHEHLLFGELQKARDRAPWSAILPDLTVGGSYHRNFSTRLIQQFPYYNLPYRFFFDDQDDKFEFEAFAMWDLSPWVFDRRELPHFGRVDRNLKQEREELADRVTRMHAEYRRLAYQLVYRPPTDSLELEFTRIRLQELAAFFDIVSHGHWSKVTGGIP